MAENVQNKGGSLHPPEKFGYKKSRIPMKKPRRTKKHHGRGGGVRS